MRSSFLRQRSGDHRRGEAEPSLRAPELIVSRGSSRPKLHAEYTLTMQTDSSVNRIINDIYKAADEKLLNSAIQPAEGELIHRAISETDVEKTIEVGCAYGLSSLFICGALANWPNPHHVIIDSFQTSAYNGQGLANLRSAGVSFFELIEKPSELALPALLEQGAEFDFALIDGFHTFDHTLLGFFLSQPNASRRRSDRV